MADLALDIPDLHHVSHANRPLEQEDQPRGKIVHDRLQAEPDADAESPHQDRDLRQVDAQESQCHDEPDEQDRVVRQVRQGEGHAFGETNARKDIPFEHGANDGGQGKRRPRRRAEEQGVAEGDPDRSPPESSVQHGPSHRDRVVGNRQRAQWNQEPGRKPDPGQDETGPSLYIGPMPLHRRERPERARPEEAGDQQLDQPDQHADGQPRIRAPHRGGGQ